MELIINNHIINTPIIEILNKLKGELYNGKLAIIKEKGDNIRVTCPFHNDGMERHPSCGIYQGDDPDIEYGSFNCFTCGEKGPLYHFVAGCFNESDEFGKEWLLERFGNVFLEREINIPTIELKPPKKAYLKESILDEFQSYHPYMTKRKLTKKVIETFKIKYDPKTQCIVFPVYDEKDKLYMLTRRSVIDKKFIIDADKEKPIYLLNEVLKRHIKEVTVVESQINALTLWGWGIPAIATFGCNITEHQFELLNKSGIRHYYLCFDGDSAGDKGTLKFINNINKDVMVDVIQMPKNKDVNDLTEDEFNELKIVDSLDYMNKKLYNKIENNIKGE